MPYQEILYEVSEQIATITFNRPEKMNAWTLVMDAEYRAAMAEAAASDEVRAIIVTGAGRGFCAGADMGLLGSAQDGSLGISEKDLESAAGAEGDIRPDFRKPYSFPAAIGKPVIAAINGHAMGLGLVNALFCDVRFAGDQAKLSTLFARRGLIAEHGLAWILPRLIGLENALDLLLSGRTVDAGEALRLGLVSRVVPQDQLRSEARSYARQLAMQASPRSIAVIKRQVWEGLLTTLGPAIDTANHLMFESFTCSDFAEGLMSFLEKRPPVFTGK